MRERAARPSPRRVAGAGILLVLGLASCATVIGIDGLEIGECKGGGDCSRFEAGAGDGDATGGDGATGQDGDVDATPEGECPGTAGPVAVHVGGTHNRFCIDSTEVTVGQYRAFLDAMDGGVGGQPPECAWNTSYTPGVLGADDIPQTGIDWCDARAFCLWAGKRLCGKVTNGVGAGPLSSEELGDVTANQWLIACSAEGQLAFPYGSVRQPGACNLPESDAGKALPVGSTPTCMGGYPGVYDMVGNVWEWIDICRPYDAGADAAPVDGGPQKDECIVKGGSFASAPSEKLNCRVDGVGGTRDVRSAEVGFRCCSP
jgi:formylglycine-generating enzyme required for sulfatase activity